MDRSLALRIYRLVFAVLVLVAIGAILADLRSRGTLDVVNFFSYFTIQSNLIGVAVFLAAAVWNRDRPAVLDLTRGAAVTYLTVTFVVFALLLSNSDVDTPLAWVDFVLHKVFPIAVVLDWLIDPPGGWIAPRQAAAWLAYPIVWVAYTLVRGALVDWYPYPFLDPANGGYTSVAAYVVGILIFGTLVILLIAGAGNALGSRRRARTT